VNPCFVSSDDTLAATAGFERRRWWWVCSYTIERRLIPTATDWIPSRSPSTWRPSDFARLLPLGPASRAIRQVTELISLPARASYDRDDKVRVRRKASAIARPLRRPIRIPEMREVHVPLQCWQKFVKARQPNTPNQTYPVNRAFLLDAIATAATSHSLWWRLGSSDPTRRQQYSRRPSRSCKTREA
jgi:hypothetical protein